MSLPNFKETEKVSQFFPTFVRQSKQRRVRIRLHKKGNSKEGTEWEKHNQERKTVAQDRRALQREGSRLSQTLKRKSEEDSSVGTHHISDMTGNFRVGVKSDFRFRTELSGSEHK